jgi:AraC-like DNA-binding protein
VDCSHEFNNLPTSGRSGSFNRRSQISLSALASRPRGGRCADLRSTQLAEAAHLSPRQFSRAFHAETGQSPAKAVENLRVEAGREPARRSCPAIDGQSRHPIDVIARQTGFADRDRMRRAFLRAFGQLDLVLFVEPKQLL